MWDYEIRPQSTRSARVRQERNATGLRHARPKATRITLQQYEKSATRLRNPGDSAASNCDGTTIKPVTAALQLIQAQASLPKPDHGLPRALPSSACKRQIYMHLGVPARGAFGPDGPSTSKLVFERPPPAPAARSAVAVALVKVRTMNVLARMTS